MSDCTVQQDKKCTRWEEEDKSNEWSFEKKQKTKKQKTKNKKEPIQFNS